MRACSRQVVAECIAINSMLQHPRFPFPTVPFPIHVGQSVVTHCGALRIGDKLEVELKPGTCEASDRCVPRAWRLGKGVAELLALTVAGARGRTSTVVHWVQGHRSAARG